MQMFDALGTRQAQMVCSAQNRHLPRSHDQWLVHSVFLQQTNTPRKIQQKLRRSRVIIMKCMDWIMNKKMIRQWMKFNCWNNVDAQIEVKEIFTLLINDLVKLRTKWSGKNKQLLLKRYLLK